MSGILRNLSAQTLGRSASVRSAARLPYAALPELFEPPAGEQTSLLPAAAPVVPAAVPPIVADRTARIEQGIGMPSLLLPRHHHAPDEPLPAPAMRATVDRDPASPLPRPAAFEAAELVESARVPPPPLVPTATRFVPPPAFAPAPPASPVRMADAHRRSTDGETTEVHVSIGRIELTAVQEPSPPARRAATVKPSMSLHEYLARSRRPL